MLSNHSPGLKKFYIFQAMSSKNPTKHDTPCPQSDNPLGYKLFHNSAKANCSLDNNKLQSIMAEVN